MKRCFKTTIVLISVILLLVTGCKNEEKLKSPEVLANPTITVSTTTPTTPVDGDATAAPSTLSPVFLDVLTPVEASLLEVGFVRVMGTTSGALVKIDGVSTAVDESGYFQRDLDLDPGENYIEVVAADEVGLSVAQTVKVNVIEPKSGLPFTVLFPPDGLEVSSPRISLVGVTTADAVVAVNGIPVEVNGVGIFSTTVDLEQGDNFLEVSGTDLQGNVQSNDVTVFFLQ